MNQYPNIAFLKETSERALILNSVENHLGDKITTVKLEKTGEVKELGPNEVVLLGQMQFTKSTTHG